MESQITVKDTPAAQIPVLKSLLQTEDHAMTTIKIHRPPIDLTDLCQNRLSHKVLCSASAHRTGCHQWIDGNQITPQWLTEVTPDLVVETFMDANYYHYGSDELDILRNFNEQSANLVDEDEVVTLKAVAPAEDTSTEITLADEMQELDHAVPDTWSDRSEVDRASSGRSHCEG